MHLFYIHFLSTYNLIKYLTDPHLVIYNCIQAHTLLSYMQRIKDENSKAYHLHTAYQYTTDHRYAYIYVLFMYCIVLYMYCLKCTDTHIIILLPNHHNINILHRIHCKESQLIIMLTFNQSISCTLSLLSFQSLL